MHELPWIMIFWSRVGWFANEFHEWWSHEWKSLTNHPTSDQEVVIHGNECIILFLTRYFISWTHCSVTNNLRSLISPVTRDGLFWLKIVTSSQLICDITRTQGTGIVTSYSSIVLARAKLAQRWSSLVNNNREYRFLTTWYSRLSV